MKFCVIIVGRSVNIAVVTAVCAQLTNNVIHVVVVIIVVVFGSGRLVQRDLLGSSRLQA